MKFLNSVDHTPTRAMDLGSGGGVPGLVLALEVDAEWVLLDAMKKRCQFLRSAIVRLNLEGRVQVVEGRAEELAHNVEYRGAFGLVTARSFAVPAATAECAAGFLELGGKLLVSEPPQQTRSRWDDEALSQLGLSVLRSQDEQIAVLKLKSPCPDRFPRRVGVPAKRPLF